MILILAIEVDKQEWNDFLSGLPETERTYFKARWLYAECYMYRRLKSIFEESYVSLLVHFVFFFSYDIL